MDGDEVEGSRNEGGGEMWVYMRFSQRRSI